MSSMVMQQQTTLEVTSPQMRYEAALASGTFLEDAKQAEAVDHLQTLWTQLVERYQHVKTKKRKLKAPSPQGLYMWGGVGRGKSWLMDSFFESIPFRRKMRMHFQHFMQRVHKELVALQGQRDPLQKVAESIYKDAVVICFDEFFVSHVTDAMILGDLFGMLFKKGVTLVATSNIDPEGLYKNGIHRERFLPAIAALNAHCMVLNVDAGVDYRLRVLEQAELFKSPLTTETPIWMQSRFTALTAGQTIYDQPLVINERVLPIKAASEDVLWATFYALCQDKRSAADYIELAALYHTVLIEDVPLLTDVLADPTRRFIYLIDELYDRRVKVVVTSHSSILELYQGEKLAFEIERTRSRLLEMQSKEYLMEAHRVA